MPNTKYYGYIPSRSERKKETSTTAETQVQINMPSASTENQTPELAVAIEKMTEMMDRKIPDPSVMERDFSVLREPLTTEDEQKQYDEMLERDFIKLRTEEKDVFFRVLHTYPEFQSANPLEFISKFVIEKFRFVLDTDGVKRKKTITSFNMRAKDFAKEYKLTTA